MPAASGSGRAGGPAPTVKPSGAAAPAASAAAVSVAPRRPGQIWRPAPGTPWQWQLSGTLDLGIDVPVYDVDLYTTSAAQVAQLHAAGRVVICYVNVGAWEDFRPDKGAFPTPVLGGSNGWPGERWLDVRRLDVLLPIMSKRLDLCRQKGFDAVEPDNVDGYANDSGFPLTAVEQLTFNRAIARLAHDRGLAVGLKNDLDQIPELVSAFDFAVNEQCAQYSECDALTPFIAARKAAFTVEYSGSTATFCPRARQLRLSTMLKHLSLDAWREPC